MMYVLEARDDNGKLVGRAEYDNGKYTKTFLKEFQARELVKTIRVLENETEALKWDR